MQQTPYCHCWIKDSLTNHWSSFCSNAESVSLWYFQPAVSNYVYLCCVEHEFCSKLKQDSPKTALLAGFAETNSPGSGGTLSKHKHCSFFIFRMITWWETPPHRFQKWRTVASNRLSVCLLKSAGRAAHSSVSTSRARPEVNTALGAVHTTPSFLFYTCHQMAKTSQKYIPMLQGEITALVPH